jgi:hypothetical protein
MLNTEDSGATRQIIRIQSVAQIMSWKLTKETKRVSIFDILHAV